MAIGLGYMDYGLIDRVQATYSCSMTSEVNLWFLQLLGKINEKSKAVAIQYPGLFLFS